MRCFFVGPKPASQRHLSLQDHADLMGQRWSTPQWSEADGWWTKAGWFGSAMILLMSSIVMYQVFKPPQKTEGLVEYTYTKDGEDTKVYLNTREGVVEMTMDAGWKDVLQQGDYVSVDQRDNVIVQRPTLKTP